MSERTVDRAVRVLPVGLGAAPAEAVARRRRDATVLAALLALLPVAARVAVNAPVGLPVDLAAAAGPLETLGLLGPGLAALVLGATERDAVAGVGLLFVGVFGLLCALAPAALVPAAVAMPAGAGLAVLAARRGSENAAVRPTRPQVAVALALLASVVVSLAGALGVSAGTLRPLGSALALVGLGAVPAFLPSVTRDWVVGGAAAAAVVVAAATAPFVLGAVLLVSLGVVATPLVLVALGVGGLAVAAAAAVRLRAPLALAGVALLLAGGVPATAGGALATSLGVVVLARAGGAAQAAGPTGGSDGGVSS